MRKRIIILTLLIVVAASGTAYGFSDVPQTAWYYNDVTSLQNSGIIKGYQDGTFRPQNNVTFAEAFKLLFGISDVRVREAVAGEFWAQNVIDRAKSYGMTKARNFSPNASITRGEVADAVATIFGLDDGSVKTDYDGNVKVSVFSDTDDLNANLLYNAGIMLGTQVKGSLYFNADQNITRAEIGAILLRIQSFRDKLGIAVSAADEAAAKQAAAEPMLTDIDNILPDAALSSAPATEQDFQNVMQYMAKGDIFSYSFTYPGVGFQAFKNSDRISNLQAAQEYMYSVYPEYFGSRNRLAYSVSGTSDESILTIRVESQYFSNAVIREMQIAFFDKVQKAAVSLIENGDITDSMTDKEKAKVLFAWMAANTEYDDALNKVSYTGYGQIAYGKAVCQGYTATYDLLCKLFGIEVRGITGVTGADSTDHIWTKAYLDGKWVHIDSTWGDSYGSDKADYEYFAASSAFMKKTHTWDENLFGE